RCSRSMLACSTGSIFKAIMRRGGGHARSRLARCACAALLSGASIATAAEPAARISLQELQSPPAANGIVDNSAFTPSAAAREAHAAFVGTLHLRETRMATRPATFTHAKVLGKQTQIFPAVDLTFFTVGADLVPVTQEVIRSGF